MRFHRPKQNASNIFIKCNFSPNSIAHNELRAQGAEGQTSAPLIIANIRQTFCTYFCWFLFNAVVKKNKKAAQNFIQAIKQDSKRQFLYITPIASRFNNLSCLPNYGHSR